MDLSTKISKKMHLEGFLRQNLDAAPSPRIIQWVDREAGIFRILWTHQSSGSFHHDDAALFRYWALARGKSTQQSSVELKQSLRMALNKSPSVERLPSEPLKPDYRYFRFVGSKRRRSKSRKQRSLRSMSAELEQEQRNELIDTTNLPLWTHHVDQDQPINLSLEATKTNYGKQFNTGANFLGKQESNETMDSKLSYNPVSECFSVTCKENIHCSSCMIHAMNHFNENVQRKNECRNYEHAFLITNKSCSNFYCDSSKQHQTTITKKPLFRPYALGDTGLKSDINTLLNDQESCCGNERASICPIQSLEQFAFLMPSNSLTDFGIRYTGNSPDFLRNFNDDVQYSKIGESFPVPEIMTDSNGSPTAGYCHLFPVQ